MSYALPERRQSPLRRRSLRHPLRTCRGAPGASRSVLHPRTNTGTSARRRSGCVRSRRATRSVRTASVARNPLTDPSYPHPLGTSCPFSCRRWFEFCSFHADSRHGRISNERTDRGAANMSVCLVIQPIHPAGLDRLRSAGLEVRMASAEDMGTVARENGDAVAAITRNAGLDRAAMERAPNLLVLGNHGIGTDAIDVAYAGS